MTRPGHPPALSRRDRKQELRRAREARARADARRAALRRAGVVVLAGVVGIGAFWFVNRVGGPTPLSAEAIAAAVAAGCDPDVRMPATEAPGNLHLEPGQDPGYTESPATSGYHANTELVADVRVLAGPVDETQAVHTLEHGSVIVYHRSRGGEGVSDEVLERLGEVARENPATYLIPYPTLPEETGLAFTAWNKILTCPASIDPDQAVTIAQGFVDSFACTSNAPEGKLGDGC